MVTSGGAGYFDGRNQPLEAEPNRILGKGGGMGDNGRFTRHQGARLGNPVKYLVSFWRKAFATYKAEFITR